MLTWEKRRYSCLQRLVQSIRKYHPNISIIIADDSPGNGDEKTGEVILMTKSSTLFQILKTN